MDQLEKEIELPSGQLMGLFNRIIRKVVKVTSAEGRVLAHFLPKDAEMLTFGSNCLRSSLSHTHIEMEGFSCNILSQRHPDWSEPCLHCFPAPPSAWTPNRTECVLSG